MVDREGHNNHTSALQIFNKTFDQDIATSTVCEVPVSVLHNVQKKFPKYGKHITPY